ncbi:RNA and export factor-binding protein 2, partial [Tetrabaena socialis]
MADKLTMSLDALIAQATRKPKDRKPAPKAEGAAPPSGPRKGLAKNRPDNAAKGSAQQQPKQPPQQPREQRQPQGGQRVRGGAANLGVRGGQVLKRNVIEPQRQPYQQRQPAPEHNKWEHDLYADDDYNQRRRAPVSQELFSTCGTVRSHGVNFDSTGRSLGTGWVTFETRAEALKAKKEYNGVKLDNQAMDIYFSDELGATTIKRLASGISVQKPGVGGPIGGSRAAPVGGGSGGQRLAVAAFRETTAMS